MARRFSKSYEYTVKWVSIKNIKETNRLGLD